MKLGQGIYFEVGHLICKYWLFYASMYNVYVHYTYYACLNSKGFLEIQYTLEGPRVCKKGHNTFAVIPSSTYFRKDGTFTNQVGTSLCSGHNVPP